MRKTSDLYLYPIYMHTCPCTHVHTHRHTNMNMCTQKKERERWRDEREGGEERVMGDRRGRENTESCMVGLQLMHCLTW